MSQHAPISTVGVAAKAMAAPVCAEDHDVVHSGVNDALPAVAAQGFAVAAEVAGALSPPTFPKSLK